MNQNHGKMEVPEKSKRGASGAGIEVVSKVMDAWQKHEGVQCNCCLAIMALVRGTGSVCQVHYVTALQ